MNNIKQWQHLPWILGLSLSISLIGCSTPGALSNADPIINETTVSDAPLSPAPSPAIDSPIESVETPSAQLTAQNEFLGQQLPITALATINGTTINLEVATTPTQQATGLMYRSSLQDDHGMLFPFTPPRPVSFWMRNVEINLDMIFIKDDHVLAIESDAPPCRTETCPHYGPYGYPVDYVLELRGGLATELGIAVGDPILITELVE